ncbi:Uncharacterised protein [[Pasteurella] mairii]|uniref:Uncharacterized protein n=1 Tax=[Pasteurella] mairii TaxID=757 RepID=A0A379B726_9PAST|nr:Uncharacterised protein [[Pasteurella] mairii]
MGYHVSIVNNLNIPSTDKILYNPDQVIRKMNELGFIMDYKNGIFFYKEDSDFSIFYDDNCLWVSNPDEKLLEVLIEIADSFNDGSIVIGDSDEIYTCLSDIYPNEAIVQEQKELIIKKILMFLYYRIWFIIPIALAIIKIFIL